LCAACSNLWPGIYIAAKLDDKESYQETPRLARMGRLAVEPGAIAVSKLRARRFAGSLENDKG
jgi:hypothetical protein